MFDVERFIEDCKAVAEKYDTPHAIREVVQSAVEDPAAMVKALGEPEWSGVERLHVSDNLTILNIAWGPGLRFPPHNHNMWAVIGIYTGREDNIFWRKLKDGKHIEAAGAKSLMAGTANPLGRDIVHSVTNPIEKFTSAIHVYGGDFFAPGRSEWDPESLEEQPYDIDNAKRIFREANERFAATA